MLTSAISRLCVSVAGQSHLEGTSQVVGTSISVGIRTFSTATGLGFAVDQSHEFGRLQLAGLGLRSLHKLRMPGEVWGQLKN